MRVSGARRVVPDDDGLNLLHRHLHLPSARPNTGGRVRRDPTDDLDGRLVLGGIQRVRDLRVQGGRQRPAFGTVDGDLDEAQRVRVVAEPALRLAGVDVVARHPLLIRLAGKRAGVLDTVGGGDQPVGESAALAQVVVVCTRPIPLKIGPGGAGSAAVELHPTMHPSTSIDGSTVSVANQRTPRNDSWAAPAGATHVRPFVACVPLKWEGRAPDRDWRSEKITGTVKDQQVSVKQ